ncbi:type VII secretion target [Actinoplanes siamensis]|uniref:Excreted virulence factor EspC (Type VII ESX diderm) n=1 Tax=Actinoplanes siamensis TaxID=1223317 RepID=A0A919NBN6_9ACTN|nr:type VII secretion target [Actinoplanes siamensis]GIF07835.1 hypothetical protein Asi03nite_53730 [Actinoplanes siamensis]
MSTPGKAVQVHPPALRDSGDQLRIVAENLAAARRQHGDCTGARDIFGTDPVGSIIGASYAMAQEIAASAYASVSRSFAGFGDILREIADEFEETDEANGEQISGTTAGVT